MALPALAHDVQSGFRDSSLFPFALATDPAQALNARAKEKGWKVGCDTRLDFDARALAEMRQLWRAYCRPNALPGRSHFGFRALKPFLRDLTMLGIVEEGGRRRYMHRFVGMSIVRRIGELTGQWLDEFLPSPIAEKMTACFDTAVDHRCPLRFVIDFDLPAVNYTRGEMFVMPLAEDGITPDMIFSLSHFTPRPGSPDLIGITHKF